MAYDEIPQFVTMQDFYSIASLPNGPKFALIHGVNRAAADLVISVVCRTASMFEGNVPLSLAFLAMLRLNSAPLYEPRPIHHLIADEGLPESLLAPVTIRELSEALQLPYETARRHIHDLMARGVCRRIKASGYVIRPSLLGLEPTRSAAADLVSASNAFIQALSEIAPRDPLASRTGASPEA